MSTTVQTNNEQMVEKFSRLFFLCEDCFSNGELERGEELKKEGALLLKVLKENGYDVGELLADLRLQLRVKSTFDTVVVFTDGGVRNNCRHIKAAPYGASSFFLYGDQKLLAEKGTYIGEQISLPSGKQVPVNSVFAEYHAVLQALLFIEENNIQAKRFVFLTDSKTMIDNLYDKLPDQESYKEYVLNLLEKFKTLTNSKVKYIPRELNKKADGLVNHCLNLKGANQK